VELLDRSTREVFGDYIDIYDMTQSVHDHATVPIYYESRVVNLHLREDVLEAIDARYDELAEQADEYNIEKSKKDMAQMDALLGARETVESLCADIVKHYEDREHMVAGKALIVAYSREIGVKIYHEIMRLRPDWTDKLKVVITDTNNDPESWKAFVGNKAARDVLAVEYKKKNSPFKIAIVVDMWLTGFDVPALDVMYMYKPMTGHNLMQAIARVNRVYPKKVGGLIVDYVGLAGALKAAIKTYTKRDDENFGDNDINKKALPKFMEKLEILRDMFHGLDYSKFITGSDLDRARLIGEGMDFIVYIEEDKKRFIAEASALRQAETLCRSLLSDSIRMEAAFFEAIRAGVVKIDAPEKLSLREINERIAAMLQDSIKSEGVVDVFGQQISKFSLFDPEYLAAIANMKQKNLAVELLKKILSDQVKAHLRVNIVQSELFSERMGKIFNAYRNGQITNAEVIEELLKLAEELAKAEKEGNALGLSTEEKAFYDALTKPEAVKEFYTNDELKTMTQELTDILRRNATVDWNKRDAARARMRSLVKRLLKTHRYPPESAPEAIDIVLKQAERWSEEAVG
jgi:type I restriction enzyme R subunit